jgi:hypothetical protein
MSKFFGGIARQDMRIGFTCEHCGREAEEKVTIEERNGSYHNASSKLVLQTGSRDMFKAAAIGQMKNRMQQIEVSAASGNFAAPDEAEGRCPNCHKYQSWSSQIKKVQQGQGASFSSIFTGFIGGTIYGGIIGIVIAIIVNLIWKTPQSVNIPIAVAFAAVFALYFVIKEIIKYARTASSLKALEKMTARSCPRFISWEGEIHSFTSGNIS